MPRNLNRRIVTQLLAVTAAQCFITSSWADDGPTEADVTKEAILYDPAAPTAGNPKAELTMVVFFDYNCPFCKQSEPAFERLVKTDGNIRLVYRDWPILTPDSIKGAQ